MTEKEIYAELFKLAEEAHSERGAVAACLVRDGQIVASAASLDNPNRHAEDLLIEKIKEQGIEIMEDDMLYSTIQPCGERTKGGGGEAFGDCATKIIDANIKHVIYALADPRYSSAVPARFAAAGITNAQTTDADAVETARKIFNETLTDPDYIAHKVADKGDAAFL